MNVQNDIDPLSPPADKVWFCPLGGSGEIGMNMNLYGHKGKWLMVDCGISFGRDDMPGVDIIMPDPTFIEDQKDNLAGLIITHAHEDHIGAVAHLWKRFKCPIYTHPFTAAFLLKKCEEYKLDLTKDLHIIPVSGDVTIGPFDIEFIPVTHSVIEPAMLLIKTSVGKILHTGDWKFDDTPLVGELTDYARLQALANEDIISMVCDSTNAVKDGTAGSEGSLVEDFVKIANNYPHRVVVGCFSSNMARLKVAAMAAKASGRKLFLMGRSLWRMYDVAYASGYLHDIPIPLKAKNLKDTPRDKQMIVTTGTQGEPNAGLNRMALGQHPDLKLEAGDVVAFSAREIPGNERRISTLQNHLMQQDVLVITPRDAHIHVSGHAGQEELKKLFDWVKPASLIPVHGQMRHMNANALIAESCNVKEVHIPLDGHLVEISKQGKVVKLTKIDEVYTGVLGLEGNQLAPLNYHLLETRKMMTGEGVVFVTLILNDSGEIVGNAELSIEGLAFADERHQLETNDGLFEAFTSELIDHIYERVDNLDDRAVFDDGQVKRTIQNGLKRRFQKKFKLTPYIFTHLIRLGEEG